MVQHKPLTGEHDVHYFQDIPLLQFQVKGTCPWLVHSQNTVKECISLSLSLSLSLYAKVGNGRWKAVHVQSTLHRPSASSGVWRGYETHLLAIFPLLLQLLYTKWYLWVWTLYAYVPYAPHLAGNCWCTTAGSILCIHPPTIHSKPNLTHCIPVRVILMTQPDMFCAKALSVTSTKISVYR